MKYIELKNGKKWPLNTAYEGDCMDFMREMQENAVDVILTDIPYGEVNHVRGADKEYGKSLRVNMKNEADEITFSLDEFLPEVTRIFSNTAMIFCGIGQVSSIYNHFKSHKDISTRLLIWEKTNPTPMNGDKMYVSGIETCIYARKPKAYFNAFCKNTVFRHTSGKKEIHETQKPMKLFKELLNDNVGGGMIVFDPCLGSFTTAVACYELGYSWIGCEKLKKNFENGSKRYHDETQQIMMEF